MANPPKRIKERRLSADEARQIFVSDRPTNELCWIYGVSDKTIFNVRAGRVHRKHTRGLHLKSQRREARLLPPATVRAIFMDRLPAREASEKYNVSRQMVELIRKRVRRRKDTRGLTPPARIHTRHLPDELIRLIYKADGTQQEIADATGTVQHHVCRIKQRSRDADVTEGLGPPCGGGPVLSADVNAILGPEETPAATNHIKRLWNEIAARTTDADHPLYQSVGGAGIRVSQSWKQYNNFRRWAIRQGVELTPETEVVRLDRTKDYSADNCILS